MATRILPLMGHNARDFARAAAVCRGWRAACQVVAATMSVYRETELPEMNGSLTTEVQWSPCSKFVAATTCGRPRLFIWRASTGALVNEWALATPATAVPDVIANRVSSYIRVAFSRDSNRMITLFGNSTHFAVWSVPDGQLVSSNPTPDLSPVLYNCADFGVPGSASNGLVGFGGSKNCVIHLWDVSVSRPFMKSQILLPDGFTGIDTAVEFSPDGSKLLATGYNAAYVYDVASLTLIGTYPDVTWDNTLCHWDFAVDVGPNERFHSRSLNGSSYFIIRRFAQRMTRNGPKNGPTAIKFALDERMSADGSLSRTVNLGRARGGYLGAARDLVMYPHVDISPDGHALLVVWYSSGMMDRLSHARIMLY